MKSVGDEVALGDELVEIETDKANMVYESDAAGTLIEIVAGEGDTLPIGEVIARVGRCRLKLQRVVTAATTGRPRPNVLARLRMLLRSLPPPPPKVRRRRPRPPPRRAARLPRPPSKVRLRAHPRLAPTGG